MGQTVSSNYVVQQKIGHTVDLFGYDGGVTKGPDCGNFGSVRRGIDTRTQQPRAIKNIQKSTSEVKEKVMLEISLMQAVTGQHPNIVQFCEYFEEWGHFDLVFEFCGNGTLDDGIRNKSIKESDAAGFCYQMLSALVFLKQRSVLHRDVKPANVLLKDDRTCKLADFGCACYLQATDSLYHHGGTPAFWPPEVDILPRGDGYSFPLDVWAVGVTFYMMLFQGVHPFIQNGRIDEKMLQKADFDSGMMWLWNGNLVQFLRWLLMPCPRQRIRPENACNHIWLGSFGFGPGSFSQQTPPKLVPDSYGRWGEDRYF